MTTGLWRLLLATVEHNFSTRFFVKNSTGQEKRLRISLLKINFPKICRSIHVFAMTSLTNSQRVTGESNMMSIMHIARNALITIFWSIHLAYLALGWTLTRSRGADKPSCPEKLLHRTTNLSTKFHQDLRKKLSSSILFDVSVYVILVFTSKIFHVRFLHPWRSIMYHFYRFMLKAIWMLYGSYIPQKPKLPQNT